MLGRIEIYRRYVRARELAGFTGSVFTGADDRQFEVLVECCRSPAIGEDPERVVLPIRRGRPALVLVCGEDY